jgi:uncharacterized membrane protein
MKKVVFFGVLLVFCLVGIGSAEEGNFAKFNQIIDTKCSKCHTRLRIEQAIEQGADMNAIIAKMIQFGADISSQEQEVMGVFWRSKDSDSAPPLQRSSTVDPLKEYRDVLERRCTGCHSLVIVEKAMAEGRSINELIGMMAKRGAVIPQADRDVLGTFWGNPLKEKEE